MIKRDKGNSEHMLPRMNMYTIYLITCFSLLQLCFSFNGYSSGLVLDFYKVGVTVTERKYDNKTKVIIGQAVLNHCSYIFNFFFIFLLKIILLGFYGL